MGFYGKTSHIWVFLLLNPVGNAQQSLFLVTVERYFYRIYGEKFMLFSLQPKNSVRSDTKYISTVTKIALYQKKVSRSPTWHMKDNGHTYLFCAILIFDNKSKLGARLDYK